MTELFCNHTIVISASAPVHCSVWELTHQHWHISSIIVSATSAHEQHQHISAVHQCISASAAAHPQHQHISSIRASTVSPHHRQHQQHQCIRSLSSISESVALAYRTRINTKTMTKHDMACELVLNCWPFRQLSTWLHDNHCDLTIKSHTGQHSQFLKCLFCTFHLSSAVLLVLLTFCNKCWPMYGHSPSSL